MAQVLVTKLHDGAKSAVFHVAITGDGSGDVTDAVLIDPTQFDVPMPAAPGLTIERLWYDLAGFDARLEFDNLISDTLAWSMTGGQSATFDFCDIGGLKDRSAPLDGTGKLTLTTSGLLVDGVGTLVIKVRKD